MKWIGTSQNAQSLFPESLTRKALKPCRSEDARSKRSADLRDETIGRTLLNRERFEKMLVSTQ